MKLTFECVCEGRRREEIVSKTEIKKIYLKKPDPLKYIFLPSFVWGALMGRSHPRG